MNSSMQSQQRLRRPYLSLSGFTFLELAIAMAIAGLALSGALLIGGKLWERDRREETREHLREVKTALLTYARKNGRLPMLDFAPVYYGGLGDGLENKLADNEDYPSGYHGNFGWLPYRDLGFKPQDNFGTQLQYFVNWQLAKEGVKPCNALKNYLNGKIPRISNLDSNSFYGYFEQPSWNDPSIKTSYNKWVVWSPYLEFQGLYRVPVAAVLISSGQNRAFDSVNPTAYKLIDEFVIAGQSSSYDDVTEYISLSEAYSALGCN